MNMAMLEPRGRSAEDEVGCALDVAVFEILPPAVEKDRVLVPEKAAIAENRAIAMDRERECLPHGACVVRNCQVLDGKIISIEIERRRPKGSDGEPIRTRYAGVEIKDKDRGLGVFTDQAHIALLPLHINSLAIDPGLHVNGRRVICFTHRDLRHRGLDRREISTTVLRHDGFKKFGIGRAETDRKKR